MAWKNFTDISGGVIIDNKEPIEIILHNHNEKELLIEKGDRVAQLILEEYQSCENIELHKEDEENVNSPLKKKQKQELSNQLYYAKIKDDAKEPIVTKVGLQLTSDLIKIEPKSLLKVSTGLVFNFPENCYGRLCILI